MTQTVDDHKLDTSHLAIKFTPHYNSNQRIEVLTPYGERIRGYVGKTTGWRPSYILLARRNSIGSSELLDSRYIITTLINRYR